MSRRRPPARVPRAHRPPAQIVLSIDRHGELVATLGGVRPGSPAAAMVVEQLQADTSLRRLGEALGETLAQLLELEKLSGRS